MTVIAGLENSVVILKCNSVARGASGVVERRPLRQSRVVANGPVIDALKACRQSKAVVIGTMTGTERR